MDRSHVSSADGTRIAVTTFGDGDGVVVATGSLSDGSNWFGIAERLADRFAVHVMTRRGVGDSEDGPDYAIEREYEDIVAALRATGSTRLVAHSFGAVCALGAALRHGELERLVLYEPPLPIDGHVIPDGALAEIEAAAHRGDVEAVVETGFRRCVRLPDEVVEALKAAPVWPDMVRNGATWPREMRALREMDRGVDGYDAITAETLLLAGELTPADHHHRVAVEALAATMPAVRVAELAGTAHQGHREVPDHLAGELERFLR